MKFYEKLVILRKKNNFSQEQLADRLGVSRQAVSKWESGTSVPDMDKMMNLCKILNCSLEELVDDGISNGNAKGVEVKFSWKEYYQEFLDFVTKTFNMFWSMRLIEKVKCILEMLFIAFSLYLLWFITGAMITLVFSNLIYLLPFTVRNIVMNVSSLIYAIFGLGIGLVLIIHIFKIRYLDYFVTIEDNNVVEKKIESPVDEGVHEKEETRTFVEKKKNKIIIRDPKHSTYHFFDFLAKIVVLFLKFMFWIVAIPFVITFIFITFLGCSSLFYLKDTVLYFGIFMICLGALLVNYLILEFIYHFIFELKNLYHRMFILFIIGLLFMGVGASISFLTYTSFEVVDNYQSEDLEVTAKKIQVNEDTEFCFLRDANTNISYHIDDTKKDITVEIKHPRVYEVYLYESGDNDHHYFLDYYAKDGILELQSYQKLLREKKRLSLDREYHFDMKITASSTVINQLKQKENIDN